MLKPVPLTDVKLTDDFWAPRLETNRTVTIPHAFKECEDTGRIRNFEIAAGQAEGEFEGIYFNDSDVHKMIEAIALDLALHPDPALDQRLDRLIAILAAAQQPDGYLNSYYTLVEPENRWTDLPVKHELYIAGHLFEAAVAHYQATGKRSLLGVATRFADYIDSVFGDDRLVGVCGHEEIELALVKLAEATGEQRYFRLAQWFIDRRGSSDREYCQDHLSVREQSEVVGHAVRAMYLYCAMADIAMRTRDEGLIGALNRLWEDLTLRRMYVTGGVGPSAHNEGFTTAYDLPNDTAYAETCAAIGLVLWSWRMFLLHGRSEYVDVLERALYNGVISGVSLTGDRFFYVNPLASRGQHHRQPWFGCACCPPNIMRLFPQIGAMMYATAVGGSRAAPTTSNDAPAVVGAERALPAVLYVNLYAASEATVQLSGTAVRLTQSTHYPWSGEVKITVRPASEVEFDLRLRIPDWCETASAKVDGEELDAERGEDGYVSLCRTWRPGDTVTLKLDIPIRRIAAHPQVAADVGRVALMRGPLVYCLEAADNEGSVRDMALPRKADLKPEWHPDLLGGVIVLRGKGLRRAQDDRPDLYRPVPDDLKTDATAIPYYAWDHRGPGEMVVWIPEITALADDRGTEEG
ncbi:MAG: glycoside hydrolase family 127 protein [Armatimonadetes bacterium]|nr:glycoside hydrolase family 127 protein [Armatimonadota bacterium]